MNTRRANTGIILFALVFALSACLAIALSTTAGAPL